MIGGRKEGGGGEGGFGGGKRGGEGGGGCPPPPLSVPFGSLFFGFLVCPSCRGPLFFFFRGSELAGRQDLSFESALFPLLWEELSNRPM